MQDLKLSNKTQSLFTTAASLRPMATSNIYKTSGNGPSSNVRSVPTMVAKPGNASMKLSNSFQRPQRFQAGGISMSMASQGRNNNEFMGQQPKQFESGHVMQPQRSSSQGPQYGSFRNAQVNHSHVKAPFNGRSGSVEMSQRHFMSQNNTMSNMEQMKNMYQMQAQKNKISEVTRDSEATRSMELDNQPTFQISGQQEEIKNVGDNYVDKSVQITPENILAAIQEFYEEFKNHEGREKVMAEFNKKAIAGWIVLQTALNTPMPAFADGEIATKMAAPGGTVSYTTFLQGVKEHLIERVRIDPTGRTAEFLNVDGVRGQVNLFNDPNLLKILQENQIDLSVIPQDPGNPIFGVLQSLSFPFFFLAGLFLLSRRNGGMPGGNDPNNPFNIGKSKAKVQMEPNTGVDFAQVAGVDEAKEELTEVVDFLKDPSRYTSLGAKIPRGVLLIGPPGTGKTLLAKAVAGEAGVPFFSISASEFIEMFVGVGASRVRDLFEQAKKNAPCIVFIDELDSVGRQRAQGIGMGNDEREQTINQLLTEMDGFEGNKGVIVLAATNIPEVLDKALLRPGRFDRQVNVALPDLKGRETILGVHAKGKKLADSVNLKDVAKRCLGMSGADLANVLNEAAILGAREQKKEITETEIYNAIDRIQIGLEKKGGTFSEERQKLVAYHEGGHALLGALMEEYDLVNKISIVPRGGAGGVTIFTPEEEAMESGMYSKSYLLNRICVAMGGRIAEEIINGKKKVTTGAQNDFMQATNTAKMMVEQMGMSDVIGPRNISNQAMSPMQQMMMGGANEGADVKNKADAEIDRILTEQYQRGMDLLTENRDVLDAIAKILIEEEKIDGKKLLQTIKNIKPELVTQQALDAIEQMMVPKVEPELQPIPVKAESQDPTQMQ